MRRFILLILLAWLPIQASAAPWLAFSCGNDSGVHRHAAKAVGHAHEGGMDHHAADGESAAAGSGAYACHHHFSGMVNSLAIFAGPTVAGDVPSHPPTPSDDFIPDLPKRPPLAFPV